MSTVVGPQGELGVRDVAWLQEGLGSPEGPKARKPQVACPQSLPHGTGLWQLEWLLGAWGSGQEPGAMQAVCFPGRPVPVPLESTPTQQSWQSSPVAFLASSSRLPRPSSG